MSKVKIVTDSTVDLDGAELKKYGIEVVPLSIQIGGKSYIDGVDLSSEEFMRKMNEEEELPKTSQPSAGEFLELYDKLHEEGYEVLSIHLSGELSGTIRTAETASNMSKGNVTVIDSRYISKAMSFQVLEAARMAGLGKSIQEITDKLKQIRENTRLLIYVDTLENLSKGGRIGKAKALLGSLLKVKPIAALVDGEYTPLGMVRSKTQAVNFLVKHFTEDVKGKVVKGVEIAHAEGLDLAQKVKKRIAEKVNKDNIHITYTSPVISTHTGPGALALMYHFE